jgi:hypothetical protein
MPIQHTFNTNMNMVEDQIHDNVFHIHVLPRKTKVCSGSSLTRYGRETSPGPRGSTLSPSKCMGTPLVGNMHLRVWAGCKDTVSKWSGEYPYPSLICHLENHVSCGCPEVALSIYPRRDWQLYRCHPADAQWGILLGGKTRDRQGPV